MNVLCVVAHPDDEVLGAGGALAKHAEAGDTVSTLFIVERGLSGDAEAVAAVLGGQTPRFGREMSKHELAWGDPFEDQMLDRLPLRAVIMAVEELSGDPDVIYTHHPGDLNLDHVLTARAVLTAFRPKPGARPCTILACEVLSSTEWTFPQVFQPNWYEKLTPEQVFKKQDALACYLSEVEEWPHPRSKLGVLHKAACRGQEVGVSYAEAFQLLRRSC